MKDNAFNYLYQIDFENGEHYQKLIEVSREDGHLLTEEMIPKNLEEYGLLEFCKCEHCPYSSEEFKYCPVFRNIANLVNDFKEHNPSETVRACVVINGKTTTIEDELQVALTSLMGLLMASSECEYFDFLRPMVKTHQPFSSHEETLIRVISLYFLDRFLCGHTSDWKIEDLKKEYHHLEKVNAGILQRIKLIRGQTNVEKEAVVVLDSFIKNFSWEYELNLDDVKELFQKGKGFLNL